MRNSIINNQTQQFIKNANQMKTRETSNKLTQLLSRQAVKIST